MNINKRLLSKITFVAGVLFVTVYVNSKNNVEVETLQTKISKLEKMKEVIDELKTEVDQREAKTLEQLDDAEVKSLLDEKSAKGSVEFDLEIKMTADKESTKEPLKTKEPVKNEITKGLSYIITKEGDASLVATAGKKVSVHYTGYLQNPDGSKGKKFDSSKDRGDLFEFPLGAGYVIKGWDMGVEGMLKGEERTLIIAPEFGYGHRGVPGAIPGGATLIFDVEFHGQR